MGRRGVVTPPYGGDGVRCGRMMRVSGCVPAIPQSRLCRDSSCCGAQNSLFAGRSQNFDRSHLLASLPLPPAALGSLPLCTREPLALRGTGMRIAASACGLLAMTGVFCHSEERSDVGIRSFVGGLVCAGVSGRPHRAAPTGLTKGIANPEERAGTEPRPYTIRGSACGGPRGASAPTG